MGKGGRMMKKLKAKKIQEKMTKTMKKTDE